MGKKNKQKNQQQVSNNTHAQVQQPAKPVIKVTNEILTTEEGELLLQESLTQMETYVNSEKEKLMHM